MQKEEVQMEIEKGKQEKEEQRKKIEETVDSQLKNANPHILTPDSSAVPSHK